MRLASLILAIVIPSPSPTPVPFKAPVNPWLIFEQSDTAAKAKVDGQKRLGDRREYRIWVTVFGRVPRPQRFRVQYKPTIPQPIPDATVAPSVRAQ